MRNQLPRSPQSILASRGDVELLSAYIQTQAGTLSAEPSDEEQALDGLITKPWGYEYRVYADELYDIWHLSLAPGQATSLHCHPRKATALIMLAGRGTVQFLHRTPQPIAPLDVLHLG